ncbi:hypothetical protein AAG570_004979 [Ranatra chinensis]|uniref:Uncharacterized protein n=1 Tax=Ranatra chinensis TaxID=642074 RepID=A0ABD0XZ44_9HEMI
MASKCRNMFQKNKTQETTENGSIDRALCPGPREKCTKGSQDGQEEARPSNPKNQQPWAPTQQQYTGGVEDDSSCVTTRRVVGVGLERDSCGLGITLRGGTPGEPLVITHLKYSGPAHREKSPIGGNPESELEALLHLFSLIHGLTEMGERR